MFNEVTFGTESVKVSILGNNTEVRTGGFMKTPLEKEVVEKAIADLPVDLQERLIDFLGHGYPVVFQKVNALKGDKNWGFFCPMTDNTYSLMLGVDHKGRLDPETVMHEFVHYRQFVDGDLTVSDGGELVWQGEFYPLPNGIVGREYLNTPWEQQAYWEQYQWAYKEGYSRLSPRVRMGIAQIIARWYDFKRTWQCATLVLAALIVLMWTLPAGGLWWIPQWVVGLYTLLQGFKALYLNPLIRKWAKKVLDKSSKIRKMAKLS